MSSQVADAPLQEQADFDPLQAVTSRAEAVRVRQGMDSARSVSEWDQEHAERA